MTSKNDRLIPSDLNTKFDPLKLLCLNKADRRPKSSVTEVLAKVDGRAKTVKFGLQDLFGETGDGPDHFDKYGFSGAKVTAVLIKKL